MRIAFQSAAIFVLILVVNVVGQHYDPSIVFDPKDVSDSQPKNPDVADENQQRRMLRSSLDTDPRTIIHKSNYGDHTYEGLRMLGGGLRFDWTNMYDRSKMTLLAKVIDYYQNPKDACARQMPARDPFKIQMSKFNERPCRLAAWDHRYIFGLVTYATRTIERKFSSWSR